MRLHFSGYTLDEDRREVLRGEEPVHLPPKAFRLLQLLAARSPNPVSKEEIFDTVWPDTFVAESNLPILVKDIRAAFGDDARNPHIVRTVFGHGYALASTVTHEESTVRPPLNSIAVLPFTSAAGGEWEYVAEGISEYVINSLARLRVLRVVPRSTSFRHKSSALAADAGRKLRVDCVCSGTLRVTGREAVIQTELIHVQTGTLLWGQRFSGPIADLVTLQNEIGAQVAAALRSETHAPAPQRPTENSEAFRLYLLGRHYWSRRDHGRAFKLALQSFAAATDLDPLFADAHAGLAETYAALATRESLPAQQVFPLARRAALRAIELDPSQSAGYTALAAVEELFDWEWDAAESTHVRAIGLDMHSATAAQWYALHLARRARHAEAEQWMSKALLLEPASTIINTNAALIAYLASDFERSARLAATVMDLDPEFEEGRLISAVAGTQLDPGRAARDLEELAVRSARSPHVLANLSYAYAKAGEGARAQAIYAEVLDESTKTFVSAAHLALAAIACNEHERAVHHACVAAEGRSPWLSYLRTETRMAALRCDPRVQKIEEEIGF